MNKKLLGILICSLLFVTAISAFGAPTTGDNRGQVVDQSQEQKDGCRWFESGSYQIFQPQKAYNTKLTKVDVVACCGYIDSMPLTLSINYPLSTVLTSKTIPASEIPEQCGWITFDFPDIELTPPNKYYIVLSFEPVSDYAWGGAWGNPYPDGNSSLEPDWDWCFRTYAEKTRSRAFNNIYENHPYLFRIILILQSFVQRLELQ